MKFTICIAAFLLMIFTGCTTSNEIYIVRHAEKGTQPPNNPPLSGEGKTRAESLKNILKDKNIKAIFSTNLTRTRETATPLSLLINVPIQSYSNDTTIAFMQRVIALKKNALIVGHSNTLLPMLDALHLSHNMTNIPDADYNNIFIIKAKAGKAVKVIETMYEYFKR
jgi:2,3-bisphosphoglycerate-dependent phosphoglycerate mutase